MENQYQRIPCHLYEYRKRLNFTQDQFSKMWNLSQNYYTELESGHYRLTYENLIQFSKNGGDVAYIITGEETVAGIVQKYMQNIQTEKMKLRFLECVQVLMKLGCDFISKDKIKYLEIPEAYIRFVAVEKEKYTIWENIRRVEGLSQVQMAGILDVQVKTYRKIEKMQKGPGAEILQIMYQRLGYSPWIFIDRRKYQISELNRIWDIFPPYIQQDLEKNLQGIANSIEKYEISNDDKKCIDFRG